jgi:hypothetical protein
MYLKGPPASRSARLPAASSGGAAHLLAASSFSSSVIHPFRPCCLHRCHPPARLLLRPHAPYTTDKSLKPNIWAPRRWSRHYIAPPGPPSRSATRFSVIAVSFSASYRRSCPKSEAPSDCAWSHATFYVFERNMPFALANKKNNRFAIASEELSLRRHKFLTDVKIYTIFIPFYCCLLVK